MSKTAAQVIADARKGGNIDVVDHLRQLVQNILLCLGISNWKSAFIFM